MDATWPFDEIRFRRLLKRANAKPTTDPDDRDQRDRAMRAARAMAAMSGVSFEDMAAELDARPIPARIYVPVAPQIVPEPVLAPVEVVEGVQPPTELDDLRERVARLEAQIAALAAEHPMSNSVSSSETRQPTGSRQAKRKAVIAVLGDPANQGLSLRALAKLADVSPETVRAIRKELPVVSIS